MPLPSVGVWNGFNRQINVLECSNASDDAIEIIVRVRDNQANEKGEKGIYLAGKASAHLILNDYGIDNAYGTFVVSRKDGIPTADSPLACNTLFYRLSTSQAAAKPIEYIFSLPLIAPKQGPTAGIFNSFSPSGDSRAVLNWLSIYNPGVENFSAQVEVYRQDGSYDSAASFSVANLTAGERRDFALGHNQGQVVGIYRVIPTNSEASYGAFITRYGADSKGDYRFAFALLSETGSCDSGQIPASTMDPALNWGEVANPTESAISANIEVRSASGEIRYREDFILAPRSQRHFFLNQFIGERQTGSFRVTCSASDAVNQRLIVQSAFYGKLRPGEAAVEWAYVSQGGQFKAEEADKIAVSINTFFGAANWLKNVDASGVGAPLLTHTSDLSGNKIYQRVFSLPPSGAIDLPVHEVSGQDFVGLSVAKSHPSNVSVQGEMLRVVPRQGGGIGYITNIRPRVLKASAEEKGSFRVAGTGHWFNFRERHTTIVGDSVTQGWMELGSNFNYLRYLDQLQAEGVNAIMIWSYIGVLNQTQDARIGYHAPRLWPWREESKNVTPPYRFSFADAQGKAQFNEEYFSELRKFVRAANERNIIFFITVHDGWTKERFLGHPFNVANGGTLTANSQYVNLADYNAEMASRLQASWSNEQKHQFYLEQFCDRLIRATGDLPNVAYEMFNEGEWYDQSRLRAFQLHFLNYFKARTVQPLFVNDDGVGGANFRQEPNADAISLHSPNWSENTLALSSFNHYAERFFSENPLAKPIVFSEPVPEYRGEANKRDGMMRLLWGTLIGGSGFFVQNDSMWTWNEAAIDPIFSIVGAAAKFLHNFPIGWGAMQPNGAVCETKVCLVNPGKEYVVYSQAGAFEDMNLSDLSGDFVVQFYNPRTGEFHGTSVVMTGGSSFVQIPKPTPTDWVLWIKAIQ